jgi:tRNA(His) 5'-end guanylyltransferase
LRGQGLSDDAATQRLKGVSVAERNELLFQNGINFNNVPTWERRGSAVRWVLQDKEGTDPRTGAVTKRHQKVLFTDHELPMKDEYDALIRGIVAAQ